MHPCKHHISHQYHMYFDWHMHDIWEFRGYSLPSITVFTFEDNTYRRHIVMSWHYLYYWRTMWLPSWSNNIRLFRTIVVGFGKTITFHRKMIVLFLGDFFLISQHDCPVFARLEIRGSKSNIITPKFLYQETFWHHNFRGCFKIVALSILGTILIAIWSMVNGP